MSTQSKDLSQLIATATTDLTTAVLSMALGATASGMADFWTMFDTADLVRHRADALFELLEIQTQGGEGPAAEGYQAADPLAVGKAVREAVLRNLMERLAFRDTVTGTLHVLGEQYVDAA
ncbi:hypothetical protein OHB26_38735 (plasmid) [Nocardia sp. NBC_01503]|uniref:hypothetical protein n=1 Tax=Nocardia sp. NBC_01503 TaxID=2975997 RepID=UPI002E7B9163|nr:hypothetical protein [Nocardia sp. NBC_01503]WTL36615.1 hypothetical protein OHB26_38735 [Nocardia sp. NBC_01503]